MEEYNIMKTYTIYSLSWSPKSGEATYTRTFDSKEARDSFRARIAYYAKSISMWESTRTL